MSTKKNVTEKKTGTAAMELKTERGTTPDGVENFRAVKTGKDGVQRDATVQEVAAAKGAYITVSTKSEDGTTGFIETYDCRIRHYDNGNIGMLVRASATLDNAETDNPSQADYGDGKGAHDGKVTLVGRGNPLGAAFALASCFEAYGAPLGQSLAYRMVRMDLDRETKCWRGLFVPALAIASM